MSLNDDDDDDDEEEEAEAEAAAPTEGKAEAPRQLEEKREALDPSRKLQGIKAVQPLSHSAIVTQAFKVIPSMAEPTGSRLRVSKHMMSGFQGLLDVFFA